MKLLNELKKLVIARVDLSDMRIRRIRRQHESRIKIGACDYEPLYPTRIGIVTDYGGLFRYYMAACEELKVAYNLVDLMSADWLDSFRRSNCDIHVVWPPVMWRYWKDQFEERLQILREHEHAAVYPDPPLLWMFESKKRMAYFLSARRYPHPETRVFYQKDEACDYVRQAALPLVFKMDMGSGARGVRIVRTRREAFGIIRRAFGKGVSTWSLGPYERERGWVVFQEYVPVASEWRAVRIGDSYFAYRKERMGDYHSGTKKKIWGQPPLALLEFVRAMTEREHFPSVSLDIFETTDGQYLINEIQVYFGTSAIHQMMIDGKPCRYRYDCSASEWKLEYGDFCRNACCNLRVMDVLNRVQLSSTVLSDAPLLGRGDGCGA